MPYASAQAMAATEKDSKAKDRPRLIKGRRMTCPKCEIELDILAFQRMEDAPKYAHDTAPVYKCPRRLGGCGFFFAPSDHAVLHNLNPKGVPKDVTYE